MALSEKEQRLLAQMEAALAAEDPKLVNSFRGGSGRRLHQRRATFAGLGFLVGLGLLIGGMLTWPGLSVIGFVVMVAAAVIGIYAWQPTSGTPKGRRTKGGGGAQGPRPQHLTRPQSAPRGDSGQGFMDKMEERWRRRREEEL